MSGKILVRAMLVLAVIGLGDATYLTVVHYGGFTIVCAGAGNPCATVQASKYSFIIGIPVALLGAIGYVLIIASLLWRDREEARLATLALVLIGFGFSAYLTYRETFTITGHPIYCEWCVGSAVILTILLILATIRYLTSPLPGRGKPAAASVPPDEPPPAAPPKQRPPTRQQLPRGQRRAR
jgi:uncharacterized membrane protein